MSSFNDSLEACLDKLYDYSSNFDINIEIIQKLAQQLKLDTFVDKDAYSHIFDSSIKSSDNSATKFQRLSIAGSFILLDIDFTEANKIINVSLSLANHADKSDEDKPRVDLENQIKVGQADENGNILVNIDSGSSGLRFLTKGPLENEGSAEEIILASLQSDKLGRFPISLKLLATLDKFSSSTVDMFLYMEKIALILQAAGHLESKQNTDWHFTEGLSTSVGKVSINDQKNSQLGIFIDFWRDFRYINHELTNSETSGLIVGNNYKAQLNVKETNHSQKDYLLQSNDNIWKLIGKEGQIESYKFSFNHDKQADASSTTSSIKSLSKNNSNWALSLDLNYPVFIPLQALQYLGISDYEESSEDITDTEIFNKLNDNEGTYNANTNKDLPSKLRISQNVSQEYIPVRSMSLKSLCCLTQVVPVLRNFIVLANLLRTLEKATVNNPTVFGDIHKSGELSAEAKNRLKASLKLPDDVTDEELMGLSAVSDNSAFTTAQINKPNTVDLNSFMKDDIEEPGKSSVEELYILFSIDDIDYTSSGYDLLISIDGLLPNSDGDMTQFEIMIKISNGVVSDIHSEGDDVNMDEDNEMITKNKQFAKGLNLTEDIIKVLQYVYLVR